MTSFIFRRVLQMLLTIVALVVITFVIVRVAPGGPAQALLGPDEVSPDRIAAVEARLGLDRPVAVQLVNWMRSVASGDLGTSYFYRVTAVDVVTQRLPATMLLGGSAVLLAIVIGIPAGCWAATRRGSPVDPAVRGVSVIVMSMPVFWIGIGLIYIFSVDLKWLPSSGTRSAVGPNTIGDRLAHLALPMITMALPMTAVFALYARNALLEVLDTDYLRTARAKGLGQRRVIWVHALRNASIPIIMQIGLTLPHVIEGSIIVETVFSWPGIGQLTTASVGRRDYPVLLAISFLVGFGVLLGSLFADIAQHILDPRVANS